GVSVRRIIWSLMKTGLVMTMVMVLTGEFLVPRSEEVAHHMKQAAIADRITLKTKYGFWARDGANFINIRTVLPGGRLRDIYLYRMNEQHELIRAVHAHKAVYRQGRWVLEGIEATDITPLQATSQILDQAEWGRFLDPALLRVVMIDANILPVWGLNRYIDFLTTNGHDASLYRMILWNKLAAPFTALALLFLSAPFLFGSLRTMGLGQRVFIGVLIGLGVFLIDVALRRLAIVYDLPPPLMAFTPSLLCLLAAGWLFRRV
ncbi:MAG: LPS export ABC transporter permease LptG, partial [Pseudomonadota bacterium]